LQLSAPASRGPMQEKKKTLAELAAESNAQHPRQPVLQSAPRPISGAPAMLTPQQQYEMQMQMHMQYRNQAPPATGLGGYVSQPPPQAQGGYMQGQQPQQRLF
jgi:hypothetical protein